MRIEAYERLFLGLTAAILVLLLGAIFWSVRVQGITLPGPYGTIDPNQVKTTAPFDEPGLRQTGPNAYEVVMRAKIWAFEPATLEVPAGSTVRFLIAPEDVVHGFKFLSLPVNVMLVPGQISVVEHTFDQPGTYTYVCHEYCGAGHYAMAGTLTVVPGRAQGPAPARLAGGMDR